MSWFKRASTGAVLSAVLASALLLVTPSAASAESNGGTRVMPLGDSITDGYNVSGGYRTRLWQHIQGGTYTVDLVGPRLNGPSPALGDRDHAGYPGNRIDQSDRQITTWMAAYTPRTVLLHLGTNDVNQDYLVDQAPARLSALIDKIRTAAPNADIFVATIVPFTDPVKEAKARTYNAAIPGIVASKGPKVHLVNMRPAITAADLADGIHPNPTGYNTMADVWYAALRAVPGSLGSPATDLAQGKAASASSTCAAGETAPKAVDASTTTKWCGFVSNGEAWLRLDLGSALSVRRWIVRHAASGGERAEWNTKDFALQYATASTGPWTQFDAVTGNTASSTDRTATATTARYWRLRITAPTRTTDRAARIYALELYS